MKNLMVWVKRSVILSAIVGAIAIAANFVTVAEYLSPKDSNATTQLSTTTVTQTTHSDNAPAISGTQGSVTIIINK